MDNNSGDVRDDNAVLVPKRFDQVIQLLEDDNWELSRISGSHHIFTKPGRRCIPVAFHGGVMPKFHARRVLKQAGIVVGLHDDDDDVDVDIEGEEVDVDEAAVASEKVQRDKKKKGSNNGLSSDVARIMSSKVEKRLTIDDLPKNEYDAQRQEDMKQGLAERNRQRQDILDSIQDLVACGSYAAALESIDQEKIDLFIGSSNEEFSFVCDALFYKIIAISELGFEAKFGSETQKQQLMEGLLLSTKFAQNFPERREEIKDLEANMIRRILGIYMAGAYKLVKKYVGADMSTNHSEFLNSDTVQAEVLPEYIRTETSTMNEEEGYKLMDEIVEVVYFIAYIFETLGPSYAVIKDFCWSRVGGALAPCIYRMLVLFDENEWDRAKEIARAIKICSTNCGKNTPALPFIGLGSASLSPNVSLGIADHVTKLADIYQYAKNEYRWYRVAGNHFEKTGVFTTPSVKGAVDVVQRIHDLIETSQSDMESLLVLNGTRKFLLNTMADCVYLIKTSFQKAIFVSNTDSGWKCVATIMQSSFKKMYNMDYKQITRGVRKNHRQKSLLQKTRFDGVRSDLVKMNYLLHWISRKIDEFESISRKVHRSALERSFFLMNARYCMLLEARNYVAILMTVLLGSSTWDAPNFILQRHVHVLHNGLDAAEWYGEEKDGEPLVPKQFTGRCLSGDEVRAVVVWTFDAVLIKVIPVYLSKILPEDEAGHLLDQAGVETLHWAENLVTLAYDVLNRLVKVKDVDALRSEKNIANLFDAAYEHLLKDGVLEVLSVPTRKRWAKRKSRKFKKLIDRIHEKLPVVQECMHQRCEALKALLSLLQEVGGKRSSVPQNVAREIKNTSNDSYWRQLLVKATQYTHKWARHEVQEMLEHMRMLEGASEKFTTLLNSVTSGRYPIVPAMNSPDWKQQSSTYLIGSNFGENSNDAIRDIVHVRGILKAYALLLVEEKKQAF